MVNDQHFLIEARPEPPEGFQPPAGGISAPEGMPTPVDRRLPAVKIFNHLKVVFNLQKDSSRLRWFQAGLGCRDGRSRSPS
jgi:hypothetical protein